MTLPSANAVVSFWREAGPEKWFAKDEAFDAEITRRFLPVHEAAAAGQLAAWEDTPEGVYALLILLDQFPRNMFRKQPDAFATDPLALAVAHNAVRKGFAADLAPERRQFQHMPFMHSEDAADQNLCVRLFEGTQNINYAVEHRDIVERFGRFPHRNKALGRVSTDAEREFLGGHEGFGQ